MVELAGEPARELHLVDGARELLGGSGGLVHELGAVLAHLIGELQGGAGVGKALVRAVHQANVALNLGELGHMSASRLGVIPKPGGGAGLLELRHAPARLLDMQIGLNLGQAGAERLELGQNGVGVRLRRH